VHRYRTQSHALTICSSGSFMLDRRVVSRGDSVCSAGMPLWFVRYNKVEAGFQWRHGGGGYDPGESVLRLDLGVGVAR
jgi:hypothetical protein